MRKLWPGELKYQVTKLVAEVREEPSGRGSVFGTFAVFDSGERCWKVAVGRTASISVCTCIMQSWKLRALPKWRLLLATQAFNKGPLGAWKNYPL